MPIRGETAMDSDVRNLTFHFNHTMLPVGDIDRSIDFYTRLLGMTLKDRYVSEKRRVKVGLVGYTAVAGEPLLELTEDFGDARPTQLAPLNAHIAIDVSDLRKLCGILEAAGIPFKEPLKVRGDGKSMGAWIRDPDGNEIELAERH
jgi:lactoylglutathione lyase